MTYDGKWVCDKCDHVSDDEHAPCDCEDECFDHIATIASLREDLKRAKAANASLIPGAMLTATDLACLTVERDAAHVRIEELERKAKCHVVEANDLWHDLRNANLAIDELRRALRKALDMVYEIPTTFRGENGLDVFEELDALAMKDAP